MLDQETKKRIFDARDILVGKIPDPKAQVEQITTALIYKFMADMDAESEDLGGDPQFFTGEYEKYAWKHLVDTRLGGEDRFKLYVEALTAMPQNPNLPQLFRDILKNAFLPYKDPETLRLFLKQINEFTYNHSEKLGDAFEYLLSVVGAQGDAGQFRTPRNIIDFIAEVLNPQKGDTILDPACGTGGFLISSYKHILRQNMLQMPGDLLTPDEKTKLTRNFVGYDISPDMVRLCLVNMYLHNFPNPTTYEYDTLTSEQRWDETADIIMANPPFMTPKGGIRPHKRFSIKANRSEILFVDYIAEHLNANGRAGIIVPEGIIFQSNAAYKALRKMLVEKYLYAVVSLPAGVFNPYSGVKTSILLLDKQLAKTINTILFLKIEHDGFDLGAQRKPIPQNDLPQAARILKYYREGLLQGAAVRSMADEVLERADNIIIVEKPVLARKGDYNLSGGRYKVTRKNVKSHWPIVSLGIIASVIAGQSPESEYYNETGNGLPFYQGKTDFGDLYLKDPSKWTTQVTKEAVEQDVLMSVRAPVGPVNLAPFKLCIGRGLAAIRPEKEKLDYLYLFYLLRNMQKEIALSSTGSTFEAISREQIAEIQIPLPPLNTQKEIVAELDNYQKIIDGAKQIAAHYSPQIKIDPSWETIKLGELCEFRNGINYTKDSNGEKIKILGVKDFGSKFYLDTSGLDVITADNVLQDRDLLRENDIVFVRSNGNQNLIGRSLLIGNTNGERITHSGFTIRLRLTHQGINPPFLAYLLKMDATRKKMTEGGTGANIKSLNQEVLSDLDIPVPPPDVQAQIIRQIQEEQQLVENNKRLIEIFEQKIKDRIADIWGSGDAAAGEEPAANSNYIAADEVVEAVPQMTQATLFAM